MLASPTSNIQRRQRQHRRQNSIPLAMEAAKVPNLPAPAMQRYAMHRRGMSFGQRAPNVQSNQIMQETQGLVANNVNMNILREAQQQRLAPQGNVYFDPSNLAMSSINHGLDPYTNMSSNENFHINACMGSDPFGTENHNSKPRQLKPAFGHNQQQPHQLEKVNMLYSLDNPFVDESTWNTIVESSGFPGLYDRFVPDNIRRMSVQSDLIQPSHRPVTPVNKVNSSYFPLTPATTPFRRTAELAPYQDNIHTSPTKNAVHSSQSAFMQRAKSLQGVPGTTYTQPKIDVPSPPDTAPVSFDSFDMLGSHEVEFDRAEFQSLPPNRSFTPSNDKEQSHSRPSSGPTSFQSSPELAFMPLPGDSPEKNAKVPIVPATPSRTSAKKAAPPTPCLSPSKAKLSPRVASIDNLNLDVRVQASIADTGISIDEIAAYISGPDPEDGKWVCLHPGCDRRFGRKENIKSHIQTHLGDRQYKCDHCDKCFVRGHDLKRHAKIHTGDKPYECLCGNVFARHDALTRHRQRGMCVGGYQGVVRKTTKRGRPKKNSRPDIEERQDKAARTRAKVAATKLFASSVCVSDSSCGSPPTDVFESMSLRGSSPVEDVAIFNTDDYCMPSDVFTFTPPASPGHSTGNKPSPAAHSNRSYTPSTDGTSLPLSRSSSKQGLEQIPEVPELPPIVNSSAASEIDIFTNYGAFESAASTFSAPDLDQMFQVATTDTNKMVDEPPVSDDFFIEFNDGDESQSVFFQ